MTKKEKFEDYDAFVKKFEVKKTTDDCYTPPELYSTILAWCRKNLPDLTPYTEIIRPFYPGGDYENADYPKDCVVIDNPPFSILAKIVNFYNARKIKYFLFAPTLTLFSYVNRATCIINNYGITYENGANIRTSFVTNIWPGNPAVVIDPDLHRAIEEEEKGRLNDGKRKLKVVNYHPNVTSAAKLEKIDTGHVKLVIPRDKCERVGRLDNGYNIFGYGIFVSDKVAAELRAAELRAAELRAAELRAAELRAAEPMILSERERQIIDKLNKQ